MTLDDIFEATDVNIAIKMRPVPSGGIIGQTFQFTLQQSLNDATPLILKTTNAGVTILDATNAVISVSLTAEDTDRSTGCGPGVYFWTLERIDVGNVDVVAGGKVRIVPV
jgi:hypothetical protein